MTPDIIRLPVRPLNVGALLEAAEASSLSDHQVDVLVNRWFGDDLVPSWDRGAHMQPNADARGVLHNLDLGAYGGYAESLADLPTDDEIDASNARADEQRRQMRLVDERGSGF